MPLGLTLLVALITIVILTTSRRFKTEDPKTTAAQPRSHVAVKRFGDEN